MKTSKEFLKNIVINGTPQEKRELFKFNSKTPIKTVIKKFHYFSRGLYPRYFSLSSAPFHRVMVEHYIRSYRGENWMELAFRGAAKTSLLKLVITFVILNDEEAFRKYIKVLCRDGKNSKQMVTDIYNLTVEAQNVYGDIFEQEGDKKREETMSSFTMKKGVKLAAGTVGQTQRGHVQDAYRPDWIIFEDVEDKESISSAVITQGVISKCDEAILGLSMNGSYIVNGNYISDTGTIEWFKTRSSVQTNITPILIEGKPAWSVISEEKINTFRKDSEDFFGEYICDPKRSENKFFDVIKIEADMLKCTVPTRESAGVKYWGAYKPHHAYGQASDHSDGIGQDANTLAGFDFNTGELMYTYANNLITPDMAALEFGRIGAEFGNCIYAPETNNKCGGVAITTLQNNQYPNIYRHIVKGKLEEIISDKLGWETNGLTKRTAFLEFKKDYNDGLVKIYDIEVLKEMKSYSNNDLVEKTTGLITRHFDLLMAVVIAWQMKKHALPAGYQMVSSQTQGVAPIDSSMGY